MAVNTDVSTIENSTKTDASSTQPDRGRTRLDDTFIDVIAESEVESAVGVTPRSRLHLSRRDQHSLFSALLVLTVGFLYSQYFGTSSAKPVQRLAAYQIDLNSAGFEELVLLEGIGEVTAEKIILDRELNGPFLAEEQLQRVKGIGPKTMERLRDHVVCR